MDASKKTCGPKECNQAPVPVTTPRFPAGSPLHQLHFHSRAMMKAHSNHGSWLIVFEDCKRISQQKRPQQTVFTLHLLSDGGWKALCSLFAAT